jgi:hypothetical protein
MLGPREQNTPGLAPMGPHKSVMHFRGARVEDVS